MVWYLVSPLHFTEDVKYESGVRVRVSFWMSGGVSNGVCVCYRSFGWQLVLPFGVKIHSWPEKFRNVSCAEYIMSCGYIFLKNIWTEDRHAMGVARVCKYSRVCVCFGHASIRLVLSCRKLALVGTSEWWHSTVRTETPTSMTVVVFSTLTERLLQFCLTCRAPGPCV